MSVCFLFEAAWHVWAVTSGMGSRFDDTADQQKALIPGQRITEKNNDSSAFTTSITILSNKRKCRPGDSAPTVSRTELKTEPVRALTLPAMTSVLQCAKWQE